jgi:hypothetical protein
MKAKKYLLQNFTRIGGNVVFPLPFYTHIQTDGSYKKNAAFIASIITIPDTTYRFKKSIIAENSTETEWASVAYGIECALEKNQNTLAVENDNLSVVAGLLGQCSIKKEYARYYKNQIDQLTQCTVWTGIRWIPREFNKADDLFRKLE